MSKSVYSLVLQDEIVDKVDRLAYSRNMNRSGLINQILAEYVSYVTPEKRMQEIFDRLENLLRGDRFEVMLQPSGSMFSLRSSLTYKYNPNVRYSVELYEDSYPDVGVLRISLRSQNSTLLLYLLQFFKLFTGIEQSFVGRTDYSIEPGRYSRKLTLRELPPPEPGQIGQAIADYIALMDGAMQLWFGDLNDPQAAAARIERLYRTFVGTGNRLL